MQLLQVEINERNVNDVIDNICTIAEFDNDFNGNNGKVYLWEEAEEKGFENNLDYVRNSLKELFAYKSVVDAETLQEICDKFFDMWLGNDDYYGEYDYKIIEKTKNEYVLVLAFTTYAD